MLFLHLFLLPDMLSLLPLHFQQAILLPLPLLPRGLPRLFFELVFVGKLERVRLFLVDLIEGTN
jgi:hypothetical protein